MTTAMQRAKIDVPDLFTRVHRFRVMRGAGYVRESTRGGLPDGKMVDDEGK